MKQSIRNIIWLLVGAALSCIAIPMGIHNGFTFLQIGACMAFILAAFVIVSWNERHFFNPVTENDDMSIWVYPPVTTMIAIGIIELIDAHECGFWLNCVGGAMLVGGAVMERLFVKRLDDTENGSAKK